MKQMKCFIVDDEPIARKIIKEYIADTDLLVFSGEAEDPVKAQRTLLSQHIDLLFLDIEMPKLNGLDYLKNGTHPPLIILITAYPQYALESYELDVVDYLVKPVSFERFHKAINKAYERWDAVGNIVSQSIDDSIYVKVNGRIEKILLADIIYIEGMANYVTIHTSARKYVVYVTIKVIEDKLGDKIFVRIHRSYIVAVKAITTIDNDVIKAGAAELPISKFYRKHLLDIINDRMLKR